MKSINIEDTEHAIKLLDDLVSSMDKVIAVTQVHKKKALELRDTLVKGKTSEVTTKAMGFGQEVGWLIEHPAQAIGKVYDAYKEAQKAVDDENKAWEQALKIQKEVREQQLRAQE